MTARIGIMGGTFDPIHIGHLVTAQEVYEQFDLDFVIFMVAGVHPLKKAGVTEPRLRYEMAVLATADNPHFRVSSYEVDREEVTFTVDTLRHLHERHSDVAEFYFITGADAVFEILEWKDAHELSHLAVFIGATRPGYDIERAKERHEHAVEHFDVRYLEVPALAVSSTDIRKRVREGRDVTYFVGKDVARFIKDHGLYRDERDLHG